MTTKRIDAKESIKWIVNFEMEETVAPKSEPQSRCEAQQEITRTIARAIGMVPPQREGLRIVGYKILCNDKEQPEAGCLKWAKRNH